MEAIELKVNQLISKWEHYCYPDKVDQCRTSIQQIISQLDSIQTLQDQNNETSKKQKAKVLYLKGKVLDLLPTYEKSAEDFLDKSLKLNPTNGDCWNTLAHVFFKKRDLANSQNAVQMALEYKGLNKVSLRYQSVLLRSQGKNQDQKRKNIQQSLKIIKKALMLDIKDGVSWYFLGNAYLSNFVANFKKFDELENALKAYNEAQKFFTQKYPDLYINRGTVESHMQSYQQALEDFKVADEIDPSSNCLQKIKKIRNRMQYTRQSFERTGQIKKSKLEQIFKSIPNNIKASKDNLELKYVKALTSRYNNQKLVVGKIISRLTFQTDLPISYLAIDGEGTFFSLSLYNVNAQTINEKIKKDTVVWIISPELKNITFQGFSFISIQVFEPVKIFADGNRLTKEQFSPTTVTNQAFEK